MSEENTTGGEETSTSGGTIIFGLASYKGAVAGLRIQSVTDGSTASSAEALDEDGFVEQIDHYGKKRTIQVEANIVSGDSDAVEVGGTLTINGIQYKVDNINKKYMVNSHATCSLSASAPIASGE